MSGGDDGLVLRPALPQDDEGIRRLVAAEMGWGEDRTAERLWEWKHERNPFGPSPRWVAEDRGRVVAARILMRWEFESSDGGSHRAVRAVDTVTARAYRGRGLFRRLTLQALTDLAADDVGFVFNTPNDQSRPGYLSMGWEARGRVPVSAWASGPSDWLLMARSRVPAALESLPSEAGRPAVEALDDDVVRLLGRPRAGIATRRSSAYLRWRYSGLPELRYRVLTLGRDASEGVCVFRVRRRGAAVEAVVLDSHGPSRPARMRLMREVARSAQATHVLSVPDGTGATGVPVPLVGPRLTVRAIAGDPPPTEALRLTLGDVELF
ncbi:MULTISPECIES: GNAT family N-acetyltransferase [unclassified Blastococcus]